MKVSQNISYTHPCITAHKKSNIPLPVSAFIAKLPHISQPIPNKKRCFVFPNHFQTPQIPVNTIAI